MPEDIRWKQRFDNYKRAYNQLNIERVGVVFYQRLESDSRGDAEGAEKTGGEGANDHEQN